MTFSHSAAHPAHWSPALVTVSATMCVSEQKQKKLSAPLVGRRGGMGVCLTSRPLLAIERERSICSSTRRLPPISIYQFIRR
jgi:hypothetical protein